jgi:hypothetical protein
MRKLRYTLSAVLLLLSTVALLAQSDTKAPDAKPGAKMDHTAPAPAPKTAAQLSFDTMKTLAGEWEGAVSTDMSEAMKKQMGAGSDMKPLHVTMRVTSRGNTITHEFQEAGTLLDAKKYDHPVTMIYLDSDQLTLVHYCDAGNRPRMLGKLLSDGKSVDFEFADVSGSTKYGHMHHGTFTLIDADHHTEDWTFMVGEMPIHAHFDLHRVTGTIAGAATGGAQ